MLHAFRESIGKYVAIAILGLIAVTFIFFGIDFSVTRSPFAATVNGEEIPLLQFERELQQFQNQYQQLYRVELDEQLRRELRRTVIDQMVLREALRQRTADSGYRISNQRLAQSIRETPAFQVGGEFSADVYLSRVQSQGMTPAGYEALQREQMTLREFENGILASTFLTPAEYRRYIELYNEQREIAYAVFPVESFLAQVSISDEAVAEHHAANQDRYVTPESVDLEYVDLDQASVAATLEVSDEELREYYEEERTRFETAEERRVSHILITAEGDDYAAAEAQAAAVLERLEAGEDFAAVAQEASDDAGTRAQGGDLGWIGRGMLAGPFEEALYAMEVGEIEGPVETEFGYHILRLEEVRSGDIQPFDAVRDELREELARDRANALFFDRANELADSAFDAYDQLASVAEEMDLPLETVEGFTRAGEPSVLPNSAAVVEAAFDEELIVSGRNSQLLELTDDHVAVIRVTAHRPPAPQPLEAVADEIREELARNAAAELAADAAAAFLADVRQNAGEAAALAEARGVEWNPPALVGRSDPGVPADLLGVAFAAPKPAAGNVVTRQVPLRSGDEAVLILSAVQPGEPEAIPAEQREQRRRELAQQAAQVEMLGYASDVREQATVRIPDEVLNPQF